MTTVVLLGTLDTKGAEYEYVRKRIVATNCRVILLDVGLKRPAQIQPDIAQETVARAASIDMAQLEAIRDREAATKFMVKGATALVVDLFARGRLHGIFALGGEHGTRLAACAMRSLPLGVPKLIVSTATADAIRPSIGTMDISIMYASIEIAGINVLTERILTNAAAAIAAMAQAYNNFELSARANLHPYLTSPPHDRLISTRY